MKKQYSKKLSQSGRSIVEMLGVLAIVGFLSVGSIAFYRSAQNSAKASQLVTSLMHCAVAISVQRLSGEEGSLSACHINAGGYTIGKLSNAVGEFKNFIITVKDVESGVCKKVMDMKWPYATIVAPDTCSGTQDMDFSFSNDLDKTLPKETEDSCGEKGGVWCDTGCNPAGYTCKCHEHGLYGSDGKTCCSSDSWNSGKAWSEENGYYSTYNAAICGCPFDDNYTYSQGKLGKDGKTCCASGQVWYQESDDYGYYGGQNIEQCGCPFDWDTSEQGKVGTDNKTCCGNGKTWDTNDNYYKTPNIALCGCPRDGNTGNNGTPNEDGTVCCSNGKKYEADEWGYGEYSHVDPAQCGCPTSDTWYYENASDCTGCSTEEHPYFASSNNQCVPCDARSAYPVEGNACSVCGATRKTVTYNNTTYCALADCGENSFRDAQGNCATCSDNVIKTTTKDECDLCTDSNVREWNETTPANEETGAPAYGTCVKPCNPNYFRTNSNYCNSCTNTSTSSYYTAASKGQCDRCPTRYWYNGTCYRPCTGDFHGTNGNCYACSNTSTITTTEEECQVGRE